MTVQLASLRAEATLDASGYTAGARQVDAANAQMERGQQAVSTSTQQTERALAAQKDQYDRIIRSMDPVAAGQARLASETAKLTKLFEGGAITVEQYNQAIGL